MDPSKLTIILGPPGTGKTTKLLSIIEEAMVSGVSPKEVAFISFTKKAADEGKERAMARFSLPDSEFPHFRTLHAMAFRFLGMRREQTFNWPHLKELGNKLGMDFKGRGQLVEDADVYGMGAADRMMFLEGLARNRMEALQETWHRAGEDSIDIWELQRFSLALKKFKESRMLWDFTDMLERFRAAGPSLMPKFKLLVVDECQDLSALQWECVEVLAENSESVYVAGDDDQCHPPGTQILVRTPFNGRRTTPGHYKSIEELDPQNDSLIFWRRDTHTFNGMNQDSATFELGAREYSGDLVCVTVDGKTTKMTPDHRLIVRLVGQERTLKLEACDLIPETMALPKIESTERAIPCSWARFEVAREHYDGKVFSLNVDRWHTYVANNIAVCNCIFSWAGADVERFISLPGKSNVLNVSHRIPATVHGVAETIAKKIRSRRTKIWRPRTDEGSVNFFGSIDEVDMSSGTWLLLARNGYMLDEAENYCMTQGFGFNSISRDPLKSPALDAVRIWETLRKGQSASAEQILSVAKFMSVREISPDLVKKLRSDEASEQYSMGELRTVGLHTEAIWWQALTKISPKERDYFIAVRKRGEPLLKKPRIKLSTIHASKGGEADHVVLLTDVSYRTFQNMSIDEDSEHRVWYVGATRCFKSLNIISPKTNLAYEI